MQIHRFAAAILIGAALDLTVTPARAAPPAQMLPAAAWLLPPAISKQHTHKPLHRHIRPHRHHHRHR